MSERTVNRLGELTPAPAMAVAALDELLDWSRGYSMAATPEPLRLCVTVADQAKPAERVLQLTDQLRVLPGRRLVCGGFLDTQPIVVKWFFGNDAVRHSDREHQGVAALHGAGVPTPELRANLRVTTPSTTPSAPETAVPLTASALIFERLPDVQPVNDALLQRHPHLWPLLWELLARLHGAGVMHTDLHFGNLLYTPAGSHQLWLIDGDGVRQTSSQPLPLASCVPAFVELVAQALRSTTVDGLLEHWTSYCNARNWPVDQPGLSVLARRYQSARRARVLHFQAKTQRTCTDFAKRRTIEGTALVDRNWLRGLVPDVASEAQRLRELLSWLDALPALLLNPSTAPLKAGNTATVVRLSWMDRPLVVKRYNNKSLWHRLRRLLRPNRGLNSWVFAHSLRFMGIPTARAVALLRTRLGGPTYLVMEANAGVELNAAHLETNEPLCQRLVTMLDELGAEGLVHNDTKASNFLWDKTGDTLTLIDLDAMQMPGSQAARLSGQKRDRRRLLRNFAATPELQRRFRSSLGL